MASAENTKEYAVSKEKYFAAVRAIESYPEFVDGMKKVTVDRTKSPLEAKYELSMMGKEMSYVLSLTEDEAAGTLNWTLKSSDFFKVNNGAWKIESTGPNSCRVHYSLEVEFNFSVPGLILKGLVKGTLPSMMNSFYERAKKL